MTSWRIDIKSLPEAAADALYKLQNDVTYFTIAQNEVETVPLVEAVLAKKAEGRPVTPEEYQMITQFVDRVERGLIRQKKSEQKAEEERLLIEKANVPAHAYEIPLEDFEISDRLFAVLSEAGFPTVGDLLLQMRLDSDSILRLNGMGPKAMKELNETLERLFVSAVEEEEPAVVEAIEEDLKPKEQIPAPETEGELLSTEERHQEIEMPEQEVPEFETTIAAPEKVSTPVTEATLESDEDQLPAVVAEPETTIQVVEEEEPSTLDELFALRPDVLDYDVPEDDEDEDDEQDSKKKKKKKKKFVEMEYDPDRDIMITRKKRKRSDLDWDDQW